MARPREFDEADVVHQAMQVFWSQGYQGTSVQDLVEATGLQRGSLYGAFGDKHGLFLEALDTYTGLTLDRFRQLAGVSADPVDAVRAFVRMAAADSCDPAMARRGCLVGNTCSELAAHDEVVRDRVERFVGCLQGAMADALRAGQAAGTFRSDRDPVVVATFVQCTLQGLALLLRSHPGPQVVDAVVAELLHVLD